MPGSSSYKYAKQKQKKKKKKNDQSRTGKVFFLVAIGKLPNKEVV